MTSRGTVGTMTLGDALVAAVTTAVTTTLVTATMAVGHDPIDGPELRPGPASSARPSAEARSWDWPLVPEPQIVAPFAAPDPSWLRGHRGVDLAADAQQAVHSPAPGVVTFSGVLAGRGVVVVAHPGGLRSTFEPVVDGPAVGTSVAAGDSIGVVGTTPGHCAPASCLHWGVLRGRTYLDPLAFVRRVPVVLLPLS